MLTPRKPDNERARPNLYKNKDIPAVELPKWDGLIRGPELSEYPGCGGGTGCKGVWTFRTIKWWDVYRKSPQAMLCTDTDWESLLLAAELHHRMLHTNTSHTAFVNMSAELRRITGSIGGSFEDRKNLDIKLDDPNKKEEPAPLPEAPSSAVVVPIDYAERMRRRQGGGNAS